VLYLAVLSGWVFDELYLMLCMMLVIQLPSGPVYDYETKMF